MEIGRLNTWMMSDPLKGLRVLRDPNNHRSVQMINSNQQVSKLASRTMPYQEGDLPSQITTSRLTWMRLILNMMMVMLSNPLQSNSSKLFPLQKVGWLVLHSKIG